MVVFVRNSRAALGFQASEPMPSTLVTEVLNQAVGEGLFLGDYQSITRIERVSTQVKDLAIMILSNQCQPKITAVTTPLAKVFPKVLKGNF